MNVRTAALGLALAVAGAGCGDKCSSENPAVRGGQSGVPACTVPAGAQVTVNLPLCPTCNQSSPECAVHVDAANGLIQIDPVVQACEDASSCPVGGGCDLQPLSCTFTAPLDPNQGYTLLVTDSTGVLSQPLIVVASGGSTTCG